MGRIASGVLTHPAFLFAVGAGAFAAALYVSLGVRNEFYKYVVEEVFPRIANMAINNLPAKAIKISTDIYDHSGKILLVSLITWLAIPKTWPRIRKVNDYIWNTLRFPATIKSKIFSICLKPAKFAWAQSRQYSTHSGKAMKEGYKASEEFRVKQELEEACELWVKGVRLKSRG